MLAADRKGASSACAAALDTDMARLVAYRPTGDAMRALVHEGDAAAAAARSGAPPASTTPAPVTSSSPHAPQPIGSAAVANGNRQRDRAADG